MEKLIVFGGDLDKSGLFSGLLFFITEVSGAPGFTHGEASTAPEPKSTPGPEKLASIDAIVYTIRICPFVHHKLCQSSDVQARRLDYPVAAKNLRLRKI